MIHPLFDLSGRVALVSGAAQNMGRSSAIALAEIGADLLITDINEAGLMDTAETIRKLGRKVIPAIYDVWNEDQIRAMYQQVDRDFGQIDIVVNIPGANILGHPEEITVEHFMKVIQATLVSKFISCQEAGRRMLARGKGSFINMSSIGGVRALGRGNFAYTSFHGEHEYETSTLLLVLFSVVIFQLFFLSVGLVISLLVKRVRSVTPYSLALGFGSYILSAFSGVLGEVALEYLTPFKHIDVAAIVKNGAYDMPLLLLNIAVTVISLAASYWLYLHRGIPAVS